MSRPPPVAVSTGINAEQTETGLQTLSNDFRAVLDEFRENWQRELTGEHVPVDENNSLEAEDTVGELTTEAEQLQVKADNLFRRAVEFEQRGKVYDALPLYRKAVQIVPDIEFKFYERHNPKSTAAASHSETTRTQNMSNALETPASPIVVEQVKDEITIDDLFEKFRYDLSVDSAYGGKLLLSSRDAGVISTELHFSDLPPEILMYILRWVVSSQLDMRSLEQCAAVSKGMYICARDEDIWRLACIKVWGHNVGTLDHPTEKSENTNLTAYYTWRDMFLLRERVLFNGCYISKTTYLRMGENSFQDQYYRPVQLVEYYRYIRFLPDGKALMMTNADEPAQGVTKLKQLQNLRADILRGYYRLFGNTITLVLQKQQAQQTTYTRQRRGSCLHGNEETNSTQYVIEFRILPSPKRRFSQLAWLHYSIVQKRNKIETSSEFDIIPTKYPPLWFSPVRSYHLDADAPLA